MSEDNNSGKSNKEDNDYSYAYIPFISALEVAQAISEKCGGVVKDFKVLEDAIGVKGGSLRQRLFNAKKYDLIEGRGRFTPSPLAMKIIKPTSEIEGNLAIKESILSIPLFKELYQRYGINIPEDEKFFKNALEREYKIPPEISSRVLNAIKKNFELLKSFNLPAEGELILEKVSKAMEEFETLKRNVSKDENVLSITFGRHIHELPITSKADWRIASAILRGLEEKWTESKKNDAKGESAKDETGDES